MFAVAEQTPEELALIEDVLTKAWEFKKQKRNEREEKYAANPLASWLLNEEDETPSCEEFLIDGAPSPFFIRRLDLEGLTRVGLYSSRNLKGELILVAEGHFRGLLAAVMFVALAKDATGHESLFSDWGTAYTVAHSTKERTVKANTALFAKILEVNPSILPRANNQESTEGEVDFLASAKVPVI